MHQRDLPFFLLCISTYLALLRIILMMTAIQLRLHERNHSIVVYSFFILNNAHVYRPLKYSFLIQAYSYVSKFKILGVLVRM